MSDYETLQRYDLTRAVKFGRFDRQWHGIVSGLGSQGVPVTIDVADDDPENAERTALAMFLERERPKPDGAA